MSNATSTTAPLPLSSVDAPPSRELAFANNKQLSFSPPVPLPAGSLSSDHIRRHNSAAFVSTNSCRPRPQNNYSHSQNQHHNHREGNPLFLFRFPINGILKIFKKLLASSVCPPAIANEDRNSQSGWDSHGFRANMTIQLKKMSAMKKYKVSNINFLNPATRSVVNGAHESFRDVIGLRPGGIYTKKELTQILDSLSSSMYFEKIEFDAKTNPDGTIDLNIPFKERVYPSKTLFRCLSVGMLPEEEPVEMDPNLTEKEYVEIMKMMNKRHQKRIQCARECILPEQVQDEIQLMLRHKSFVRASLLARIISRIQKWYHDNRYYGASVVNLGLLDNQGKEIIFEVNEGDITDVGIKFHDNLGNTCEGNTNIKVIKRALPEELAVGKAFNQRVFEKALQNIHSLNLFSSVNIVPKQDETTGSISAEILLQEQQGMWSDVKTDWNVVPGRLGLPTIDLLRPGATIQFGHRNIKGLNRSFEGAITLSNLFDPEDDIDFNFDYTHPYLDGIDNRRNRTFRATCFNTRKLSPVFRGATGADDIPIWVDRKGIKATITEDYTKQSKFTYGLVVEDIKTRDEEGNIAARGHRVSLDGQIRGNGPSATLSGTGNDRLTFLQANLTRDNTRFVNGALVGARDVFQVDQGIGIGTKFAFFNRAKVSATRFIPLRKVKEGKGNAAPPVLVLHGLYGNCVGDLPNHEAFTIGGPHSVRGYNVGEIGASRSKLEVAAEVRIPVKNATVYGFAEHGNDLGSSVGLAGNPTKSYMRKGHGSSYGLGIKFGQLRAEYAVDHNTRKGAFFFHFGDRF
ncbi:protein toc75-3 chloroplastic [Phtheirospermum japonicum]|uniref:Protein toc75-3 chloroplastic n=1 Tax=Phtheirospermum japonicum TaxID=374723 RepID=A0A830CWP2_9LAMI|nr:protein toc75-3 chloroplastic [Phtheirospermum japonicum]